MSGENDFITEEEKRTRDYYGSRKDWPTVDHAT
jgi:hypothetical protein